MVRRRFAGNAAHVAVRDGLQALRGPAALLRNSPARRARITMTRGWAVESGGSTSCEWKEGGNAACSALVNCLGWYRMSLMCVVGIVFMCHHSTISGHVSTEYRLRRRRRRRRRFRRNKRWSRAHAPPGLANSSNQLERANGTLKVLCGKRRMSPESLGAWSSSSRMRLGG